MYPRLMISDGLGVLIRRGRSPFGLVWPSRLMPQTDTDSLRLILVFLRWMLCERL